MESKIKKIQHNRISIHFKFKKLKKYEIFNQKIKGKP